LKIATAIAGHHPPVIATIVESMAADPPLVCNVRRRAELFVKIIHGFVCRKAAFAARQYAETEISSRRPSPPAG
jgi:hypothetical protein